MKYWYDTEFFDDGHTIDLISIGIIAEDGREYYAVSSEFNQNRVHEHDWLMRNVWPHLPTAACEHDCDPDEHARLLDLDHSDVKSKWTIAQEVSDFLKPDTWDSAQQSAEGHILRTRPELWAWYGAYDHVVLMQLFGTMMDKPDHLPMLTYDLKQVADQYGVRIPDEAFCRTPHHALGDARTDRNIWMHLNAMGAFKDWGWRVKPEV